MKAAPPKPKTLEEQLAEAEAALRATQRLEQAVLAHDDLLTYIKHTMPDPQKQDDPYATQYRVTPLAKILCDAMQKIVAGELLYLCVSAPPQHGKTTVISRSLLPWYSGKFPHKQIMYGTYSQDRANEMGGIIRTLIQSPEHQQVFPNYKLKSGSRSKEYMANEHNGRIAMLGRGGAGTGRTADLWVIDDPIKDDMEAQSSTIREQVWQWFTKVVFTRAHVLTPIIVVLTRWHEDDIIGRLTDKTNPNYNEEVAKKFLYVNIPAIIDTEPMAKAVGCKVGETLWPERFPLRHLETARQMNPLGFNAMYMGRPTPPEGAFFKREQFQGYRPSELPKELRHYLSGDLALSPERDRDSSCVGHWGLDSEDTLWLLPDLFWEQKAADDVVENLIKYGKDHPIFTYFGEKGQIEKAVGPFLAKRMQEEGIFYHIQLFPSSGNKGARATAFRGRMAQGKVRWPTFAPWWPRFMEVMLKFTGSGEDREDDVCDMCGLIGQGLQMQVRAAGPKKQGNVIIPGTLAWVKKAHNDEQREKNRIKSLRGM